MVAKASRRPARAFSVTGTAHRYGGRSFHIGHRNVYDKSFLTSRLRQFCDLNRDEENAFDSKEVRPYYLDYHEKITKSLETIKEWGGARVLLLDIHGQVTLSKRVCIFILTSFY